MKEFIGELKPVDRYAGDVGVGAYPVDEDAH